MTPYDPNTFDDPQLKAALRRAWGDEVAPATLRERVMAMGIGAAGAPAADITPSPAASRRTWFRTLRHPRVVYGLAAAVTLLIGFTVAYRLDQPPAGRFSIAPMTAVQPARESAARVLPASVTKDLVDVHARCRKAARHESFRDVPRNDFEALRHRLDGQLGFQVLAAPLDGGEGGWAFRGGAICPVDRMAASHLVFVRKGQAVSIFSLPRSACPQAQDDTVCEAGDPDHPVAAFVRPDGVHCVVGSSDDGSLSPEQVRLICEHLRSLTDR